MSKCSQTLAQNIFPLCVVCHYGAGGDSGDKAEYEPDRKKYNQENWTGNFHKNEKEKQRSWLTLSMKRLNSIEFLQELAPWQTKLM